jgi:hypothetical protein
MHAAEELQQYVKKSSGVTLEICAQNDITATSAVYIGGKVGVKKRRCRRRYANGFEFGRLRYRD